MAIGYLDSEKEIQKPYVQLSDYPYWPPCISCKGDPAALLCRWISRMAIAYTDNSKGDPAAFVQLDLLTGHSVSTEKEIHQP